MNKTLFTSVSRAGGAHTSDPITARGFVGGAVYINYTAGTGSTVVQLQRYDTLSGTWTDVHGALTAALATSQSTSFTVYPGVAETANRSVSDVLGDVIRATAVITTYPATFTVSIDLMP
jgi:hypothetical protein